MFYSDVCEIISDTENESPFSCRPLGGDICVESNTEVGLSGTEEKEMFLMCFQCILRVISIKLSV